MPLFEIGDNELIPFRRVQAGPDLYEEEIESLLWANLDSFVGVQLFPLARQPTVGDGIRPDIVALDIDGHVHVIEVKRDVDRRQLAQCLEYAGWARNASLDELAGLFHGGAEAFFAAWTEFTGSDSPRLVQRPPQLVLVARDFDDRTDAALSYLTENNLPITVLGVTIYEDQERRRFVDVMADHELDLPADKEEKRGRSAPTRYEIDGRRIALSDLLDAGLLLAGAALTWIRPRIGATYRATVLDTGQVRLEDGRTYASPSKAAMEAADVPAYDGWQRVLPNGRSLDLRPSCGARVAPGGVIQRSRPSQLDLRDLSSWSDASG
jgi:hypothetical protein